MIDKFEIYKYKILKMIYIYIFDLKYREWLIYKIERTNLKIFWILAM